MKDKEFEIGDYCVRNSFVFIKTSDDDYSNNHNIAINSANNLFYGKDNLAAMKGYNEKPDRHATLEEKHWLDECIRLNKYISKEEALKTFNQIDKLYVI
jgi:hypothetical protein